MRAFVRGLTLLCAATAACRHPPGSPGPPTPGAPAPRPNSPRPPLVRELALARETGVLHHLAGGQVDAYEIELPADTYLHATFEQRGVDLAVDVVAPGGRRLFHVDSPNRDRGNEEVHGVAESAGRYRLEVAALPGTPGGDYLPLLRAVRKPGAGDRDRAAADRAFYEARKIEGQPARFWEAAAKEERALRLYGELKDRWHQAYAAFRLARLHLGAGRAGEARDLFDRAERLFRTVGDRHFEASAANWTGQCSRALADFDRATAAFARALAAARRGGDVREQALAWHNLGSLLAQQGRSWPALAAFRAALALWPAVEGKQARADEAETLTGLGEVYAATGDWPRAIAAHTRALHLCNRLGDQGRSAASLTQIGGVWLQTDPQLALPYLERAWELLRASGSPRDRAAALNGLGVALRQLGRYAEAQAAYRQALPLYAADPGGQAIVWINLAWTSLYLHQPDPAMASLAQGLRLARQTRNVMAEARALLALADAELQRGDPTAARVRAEASLALVEAQRAALTPPDLRTSYLAANENAYDLLIRILMEGHRQRPGAGLDLEALARSEQERARSLHDALRPSRRLRAAMEPGSFAVDPARLGALLGPDTLLLEYSLGSPHSYLWLAAPEGVQSFVLPDREILEPLARAVRARVARPPDATPATPADPDPALVLSRHLLGPVARQIAGRRLLIAGDSLLQLLPFAALPDPDDRQGPLLLRHEIVYVPSLAVLAELRARAAARPPAPLPLALLGDPVFDPSDERLPPAAPKAPEEGLAEPFLPRLPRTRDEVAAIAALLPAGQAFTVLGFAASRDLALSGRLSRFRVLHLATHGVSSLDHPELSSLVLSRFDARGRPRDGYLRAADLAALDLPADLVVLSACGTALGRETPGEGVVGLPQAFFRAGATRVVVTLWPVEEESTAALMAAFYRRLLRDHLPPGRALREAQLAVRGEPRWREARYWAGFVLLGDWR